MGWESLDLAYGHRTYMHEHGAPFRVGTTPWATVAFNMPSATTAAHWSLQKYSAGSSVQDQSQHSHFETHALCNNYSARKLQT